ncbi:MAG: hypothetical protein Q9160_008524 [Pyrenula sp. 1 TL-2023]
MDLTLCRISKVCASLSTLATQWEALQRLHQMMLGVDPAKAKDFQPWFASQVEQMFKRRKVMHKMDGEALASMLTTQYEYKHGRYIDREASPVVPTPPLGIDAASGLHVRIHSMLHQPDSRTVAVVCFLIKLGQSLGAWHADDVSVDERRAANPSKANGDRSPDTILCEAVLEQCLKRLQSERECGEFSLESLGWLEIVQFTHICFRYAQPSLVEGFWVGLSSAFKTGDVINRWSPFLKCLLRDKEISTLINRTSSAFARRGFMSMLLSYTNSVIVAKPQKARTWAREVPESLAKCATDGQRRFSKLSMYTPCDDCRELRDFVKDPQVRAKVFWGNENSRKHRQHQLPYGHYIVTTDRSRKPFGLYLQKTAREYTDKMCDWERRRGRVRATLREWEQSNPRQFQDLLGKDYDDVMSLKEDLKVNEDGSITATAAPDALSETNQKANSQRKATDADAGRNVGRKRKAGEMETENEEVQIIDLT